MHPSSQRGRAGPGTDGSFASVAMRPPGSPWYRHAGESALHERDHRGGDHPIPFRTRQLSPPSPKVLQRQAAGGQGVALMQGASAYFQGLSALFPFRGPRGPFLRSTRIHQTLLASLWLKPKPFRATTTARVFSTKSMCRVSPGRVIPRKPAPCTYMRRLRAERPFICSSIMASRGTMLCP